MLSANAYLLVQSALEENKENLGKCLHREDTDWSTNWNKNIREAIAEIERIQGVLYEVQKQAKVD